MWSMWSFICAPKCACSKQTLKGEVSWVRERREERGESSKKRELQGIEKKFRASIMASMLSSCIIRNRYCYYYYGTNRSSLLPSIAATNQPSESSKQLDRGEVSSQKPTSRREMILRSSEFALLGAIFHFSGTKPNYLGVQKSPPALALCPATNNCISTSEGISDLTHYAPPWNYNPEDGRGKKKPVSRDEAMAELTQVIKSIKPDKFTPRIMEKKDDYIRVEYESPIMGFVDDVEFWFPPDKKPIVEYRSASRLGNFDFDVNKKRIKAIRLALEKKGWASEGTF